MQDTTALVAVHGDSARPEADARPEQQVPRPGDAAEGSGRRRSVDAQAVGLFLSAIAASGITAGLTSGLHSRVGRPGLVSLAAAAAWGVATLAATNPTLRRWKYQRV